MSQGMLVFSLGLEYLAAAAAPWRTTSTVDYNQRLAKHSPMNSDLFSLPTPFVAIDLARVRANIAAMQALADGSGVRLRPHAKTHKSIAVARWQIEAGAVGICCAKLGEAEVFAGAGIADIRLPYPLNPSNVVRVTALQDRVRLSTIVDNLDVATQWSRAMAAAGRSLDVLVKIDVGFHRCGLDPAAPAVVDTIRQIAALPGLAFRGLLSHAGHAYGAESSEALAMMAADEATILGSLAAALRDAGVEVEELSVGSTPTARFIGRQQGVTEMRPGNYVIFDRTQVGLGAATLDDCAMSVVSTVVSRPSATRVVFDAGSKTLTSDTARGFGSHPGHGLVFPSVAASTPDESIVIERLSEEHAVARVEVSCALRPGDRVRILPNHGCPVMNLADELVLVEQGTVVGRLRVDARGKNA
jgi:D-serine deaminase-like pyridoxal phosphate-dependent protein